MADPPPERRRTWIRRVAVGALVLAAVVGASAANVALLDDRTDDGLGRLSPIDPAVTPTRAGTTATSPTGAPAARPATGACTEAGDDRCRPRTDDHGPGHHGGDDD